MAQIIEFRRNESESSKNELEYSHCICGECNGNKFYIRTEKYKGKYYFYSIICVKCNSEIFCNLQPVSSADEIIPPDRKD